MPHFRAVAIPGGAERRGSLGEERPPRPPFRRCLAVRRPDVRVPDVAHRACSLGPGLRHAPPASGVSTCVSRSRAPLASGDLGLPASWHYSPRLLSGAVGGCAVPEPVPPCPRRPSALARKRAPWLCPACDPPAPPAGAGCASPLLPRCRGQALMGWAWLAEESGHPDIRDSDLFPRPPAAAASASPSAPPTQLLCWIRVLATVDRSVT